MHSVTHAKRLKGDTFLIFADPLPETRNCSKRVWPLIYVLISLSHPPNCPSGALFKFCWHSSCNIRNSSPPPLGSANYLKYTTSLPSSKYCLKKFKGDKPHSKSWNLKPRNLFSFVFEIYEIRCLNLCYSKSVFQF